MLRTGAGSGSGELQRSVELADLHLGIGPSWDLYDHVEDGLLLIGVQRDVVEWRDNTAMAVFDVNSVLEGERLAGLSCAVAAHIGDF